MGKPNGVMGQGWGPEWLEIAEARSKQEKC